MPAKRGENRFSTYQLDRTQQTLKKIRNALQTINPRKVRYKNLGALISQIAKISGVSRTTINPKRNREAYVLCAEVYANQGLPISQIPDEVADEYVLREKLRVERLKLGNLVQEFEKQRIELEKLRGKVSDESLGIDENAFVDTASILLKVIHRFNLEVDTKTMMVRDPFPERGQSDIIAKGVLTKAFCKWLASHPSVALLEINNDELSERNKKSEEQPSKS